MIASLVSNAGVDGDGYRNFEESYTQHHRVRG